MDIIMKALRAFLWGLVHALLKIGDGFYSIVIKVAGMDINKSSVIWDWWSALSILIGAIATIRVLNLGIRYLLDDKMQEKIDWFKILGRILMVSMVIALMPIGVGYITGAGSTFIKNIGLFTNGEENLVPSTLMISSVLDEDYLIESSSGSYTIPKNITLEEIEINDKDATFGGDYVYFKTLGDIFTLLIVGGISVAGLVLIGLEIAERYFKLGIKILISPIPISGIVNPEDQSFQKWYRLVIADVVLNSVQVLGLLFVLQVASSNAIRSMGFWVSILMFVGGLFAILKGVPELAPILGGDTSSQGALQQMAALRQATRGGGAMIGAAAGAVGGAALTGAAMGAYSVGRHFGGESISNLTGNSNHNSESNFNSDNTHGDSDSFFDGQPRNNHKETVNTSSNDSMSSHEAGDHYENFSDPYGRSDDYMDHGNTHSKGEGHQFESGGYQRQNQEVSQFGNSDTFNPKQKEKSASQDAYDQNRKDFDNTATHNYQSSARVGTPAHLAAVALQSGGGSKWGRAAAFAGRHVYKSSINRINRSMPGRTLTKGRQIAPQINQVLKPSSNNKNTSNKKNNMTERFYGEK